ncbi:hypothetical protein Cgig2_018370 [Carnegiea gigantea]|uniref:RRM domain-containing protein n=1 Tax=Carnegiea gigantea TaxID=171969 RepID=A0A9Q1JUR1_9CARY|nr:hypothetical protein Cgig2_018370 [Carnegiea gigantea]
MAGPVEDGGSPIRARFQALKDELKHLVLSISEGYGVQDGDPYVSMAAFDRAKEALSAMRELKGLLSKLSPLPNATSSAHFMASRGNERVGSSRYEHLHSIFIENLPSIISTEQLQAEFASFRNVVDSYISNRVARKSGMRYGFVRFQSKEEVEKAIHSPHWKQLWGNVMSVKWAKFQKRSSKSRMTSKCRFAKNKNHAKRGTAGHGLENTQANKEADGLNKVEQHRFEKANSEGDQEACSETSRMISMSIGTAKTHPTYIGKLTT